MHRCILEVAFGVRPEQASDPILSDDCRYAIYPHALERVLISIPGLVESTVEDVALHLAAELCVRMKAACTEKEEDHEVER